MTRTILVDGDSLARSPDTGQLSPTRLGMVVGALIAEIDTVVVDLIVLVSHSFGSALTTSQIGRLERTIGGPLVIVPEATDLRDFIVASANDGQAIIVSNNAFARQAPRYPWLAHPDSGRHVLARAQPASGMWSFIEARFSDGTRRTLHTLLRQSTPRSDRGITADLSASTAPPAQADHDHETPATQSHGEDSGDTPTEWDPPSPDTFAGNQESRRAAARKNKRDRKKRASEPAAHSHTDAPTASSPVSSADESHASASDTATSEATSPDNSNADNSDATTTATSTASPPDDTAAALDRIINKMRATTRGQNRKTDSS